MKRFFVVALSALVLLNALLVSANCPGNCSNHGTCVDGICVCDEGWVGAHCAYRERALPLDSTRTSSIGFGRWEYWTVENVQNYELAVTASSGLATVYTREKYRPTNLFYDQKVELVNEVSIPLVGNGDVPFYIALESLVEVSYSITVRSQGQCKGGCSGHGRCDVNAQKCICDPGYGGERCEKVVDPVVPKQKKTLSLEENDWAYYEMTVGAEDDFTLKVEQTSGDIDTYIRYEAIPTRWKYDYADLSVKSEYAIEVSRPNIGKWYIGFYAYRKSSFSFTVDIKAPSTDCPNACSGPTHGTCRGNTCSCASDYGGDACEIKTSHLVRQERVEGQVGLTFWNWFTFQANSANSFTIQMNHTDTNDDCDLYVQREVRSTTSNFAYRDISYADKVTLVVPNPGLSTWHIGIFGIKKCHYTLMIDDRPVCPDDCNGRGQCIQGRCHCGPDYAGDACEYPVNTMTSGAKASLSVEANEWKYYSIEVASQTDVLHIVAKEESGFRGMVRVFASLGVYPTLDQYDLVSEEDPEASIHTINARVPMSFRTQTVYIGVYGTTHIPARNQIPVSLSAWYPDV